jgi:hypothetical protein
VQRLSVNLTGLDFASGNGFLKLSIKKPDGTTYDEPTVADG